MKSGLVLLLIIAVVAVGVGIFTGEWSSSSDLNPDDFTTLTTADLKLINEIVDAKINQVDKRLFQIGGALDNAIYDHKQSCHSSWGYC